MDMEAGFSAIPEVALIPGIGRAGGSVCIHRLDKVFPVASGNKAFKLLGHFLGAQRAGKSHLLSFGGAWSNHLHALSAFAASHSLQTTAIVRGLYVDLDNPVLADARRLGMSVHRVSKQEYARRRDPAYLAQLRLQYPDAWLIAEGGDDAHGRWGMRRLANTLRQSIPSGDTLVVASGTGATIRGLAMGLGEHLQLVSALVVKDDTLARRLEQLCRSHSPLFRLFDMSGRGYGRTTAEQLQEIERLYQSASILLDPLYNGKAWACAVALAEQGERVHLLHTGGAQGWRGFLSRGLLDQHPLLAEATAELSEYLSKG